MNFEKRFLERLHTIGDVVVWLGWLLFGSSIIGAVSYYYTPLVPQRGLSGMISVASVAGPLAAAGIALVLIGGAFRQGRSWGRVGLIAATILLEVPLLYGWYRVLIAAAGISYTAVIQRGVLSLVVLVPLSFLIVVAVQWLQSPIVTAAFDEGHLADFDGGDESTNGE